EATRRTGGVNGLALFPRARAASRAGVQSTGESLANEDLSYGCVRIPGYRIGGYYDESSSFSPDTYIDVIAARQHICAIDIRLDGRCRPGSVTSDYRGGHDQGQES